MDWKEVPLTGERFLRGVSNNAVRELSKANYQDISFHHIESKAASPVQLSHDGVNLPIAVCWSGNCTVLSGPGVSDGMTKVAVVIPSACEEVGRAAVKAEPEKRHMIRRLLNIFMVEEAQIQ